MSKYPFGSTIYVIFATSNKAIDWLTHHYGNHRPLTVEHRYINDIVEAMAEAGLERGVHYSVMA